MPSVAEAHQYVPLVSVSAEPAGQISDSAQLALSNALAGNTGALWRSLSDPTSLSPEERRKISDRLGITNTVLAKAVDITTHPLLLTAIALSFVFRFPTIPSIGGMRGEISQLVHRFKPLEWISPFSVLYEGSKLPAFMDVIAQRRLHLTSTLWGNLGRAMERFSASGVKGFSDESAVRIGAYLDAVHDPTRKWNSWKHIRGYLFKKLDDGRTVHEAIGYNRAQAEAISLKLAHRPMAPVALSGPEKALADDIRKNFFDVSWRELDMENPAVFKRVRAAFEQAHGYKFPDNASAREALKDYWPHQPIRTPEQRQMDIRAYIAKMQPRDLSSVADRAKRTRQELEQYASSALRRKGALIPRSEDLQVLGADPQVVDVVQRLERLGHGVYPLNDKKVLEDYMDDVGRMYAWTTPPKEGLGRSMGELVNEEMRTLLSRDASINTRIKIQQMNDVYIPMTLGAVSSRQAGWAMNWAAIKERAAHSINQGVLRNVIPKDARERWTKYLLEDPASSMPAMGSGLTSWMYASTLGLNALSPAMNMMQTVVTLMPTVGGDVWYGLKEVNKRLGSYVRTRIGGVRATEAFAKVFPEFHALHLELDPLARSTIEAALEEGYKAGSFFRGRSRQLMDKTYRFMMGPFTASESFNRLVGFYASMKRGLRRLPGTRQLNPFTGEFGVVPDKGPELTRAAAIWARQNTLKTHFGGGPLNRPSGLVDWWQPFTQFTSYPLNLASFALTSPRPIQAATLVSSLGAYSVLRETTGSDFSRALLFGGLPAPEESGPWAPLPLVPPTVQILGSMGLAAAGKTDELGRIVPLLVPGGTQAARLTGAMGAIPGLAGASQAISQVTGRPYADYRNPGPDGKYPVYRSDGSLIGYFSGYQLMRRALGFGHIAQQQEEETIRMLLGNRDRIQGMKREAMQALYDNDPESYMEIREKMDQAFPGTSRWIISKQDMEALHMRREVSRMERVMRSMPTQLREEYTSAISAVMGSNFPAVMGTAAVQPGPAAVRDRYRARPLEHTTGRVSQGLHGVSLREKSELLRRQAHERKLQYGDQYGLPIQ